MTTTSQSTSLNEGAVYAAPLRLGEVAGLTRQRSKGQFDDGLLFHFVCFG